MKEYIGRMTKRDDDGQVVMDCQNCELSKKYGACNSLACRDRMKERLAGYEDAADVVERKRGEWHTEEVYGVVSLNGYVCSVCGGHNGRASNFCPNCGADMRQMEGENV